MARIPIPHEDDPTTPADVRASLERTKQEFGLVLNVNRTMATHPKAADRFLDLAMVVYAKGSLTLAQAELAYTTATVVNNCHY